MDELAVARWRKYGLDRLYVSDGDRRCVGWIDVVSGQVMLNDQTKAEQFYAALAKYGLSDAVTAPSAGPVLSPHGESEAEVEPDPTNEVDLQENRPGQSLRSLARDESEHRGRLGTLVDRLLDRRTQERSWRLGARGEEVVGRRLEKLTAHGWHVLHSVPVGARGADIDHVLIGPGGVFTLNTKNHPDKSIRVYGDSIRVNGRVTDYVPKARHEYQRAQRLLSDATGIPVTVRAALVMLTGTVIPAITVSAAPEDVIILDRRDVPNVFRRAEHRLTTSEIDTILQAARSPRTWSRTPSL